MAEVLGIVASGISVATLASQVVRCIQELHTLSRSIRDLPHELKLALAEIEILGEIFSQVGVIHHLNENTRGANILLASLGHCKSAAATLEKLAAQLSLPLKDKSKKRPWRMMKVVLKKEEVRELQQQLEAAKSLLHLAMTCYSLSIHQNSSFHSQDRNDKHPNSKPSNHVQVGNLISTQRHAQDFTQSQKPRTWSPYPRSYSKCAIGKCQCICHAIEVTVGSFWELAFPQNLLRKSCNKVSCVNYQRASLWISLAALGIPFVVTANLEVMWNRQTSWIAPSLQIKRVVNWDAPAFRLLRDIRWSPMGLDDARGKMLEIFDSGAGSPFDILPDGKTLPETLLTLPWPNGELQLKLLESLVVMGSPLNTAGMLYRCAGWNSSGPWRTGLDDQLSAHTHLLNTLLRLGFDTSEVEAPSLSKWPEECSPIPAGRHKDLFFMDWMSKALAQSPDFAGMSLLHEAVLIGTEADVRRCSLSCDVDDENMLHQTALHLAVSRPKYIPILVQARSDVDVRDCNGRTPLVYAAVTGSTQAALSLLEAGANLWIKDNMYGSHDFIHYAIRSDNWALAMTAIDFVRQSPLYSSEDRLSLLNDGIVLWEGSLGLQERRSEHFKTLLKWGANPDIEFQDRREWRRSEGNTLLHTISLHTDLDTLLEHNFTKFNHSNSYGENPLMTITEGRNRNLLQLCIERGCQVNHQDHLGRTALHVTTEDIWDSVLETDRLAAIRCAKVLLQNGSDPFLGDHCVCACSEHGCSAGHILLKLRNARFRQGGPYYLGQYIWSLEWINLLKISVGFDCAKQWLVAVKRLTRFEELELTHTCCRKDAERRMPWRSLDAEEVDEIRDEESEIITQLDEELLSFKESVGNNLEDIWLNEIRKLLRVRAREFEATLGSNVPLRDLSNMSSIYKYQRWIRARTKESFRYPDQQEKWFADRLDIITKFQLMIEEDKGAGCEIIHQGNLPMAFGCLVR